MSFENTICLFFAGLLVASPDVLGAQSIPRVTFEIAGGSGPHSESVGETWFRSTKKGMLRVGGTVGLLTLANRASAVLRADYSVPGMADKTSDCPPAPNGTCRRYFPATDGFSVGAGLLVSPTRPVLVGVAGGFSRSKAHRYGAVSASYKFAKHVAALAEWRYMSLVYAGDDRVSYRPLLVGVRVH